MSHNPKYTGPVAERNSAQHEKQLAALDRSHQNRQNAKAQPVRMSTPKPPKR
jgi:hypothetical protein